MANAAQQLDKLYRQKSEVDFSRNLLLTIGDKCIAKCVENDKKPLNQSQKDCLEYCVDTFFHTHAITSQKYLDDYRSNQGK